MGGLERTETLTSAKPACRACNLTKNKIASSKAQDFQIPTRRFALNKKLPSWKNRIKD